MGKISSLQKTKRVYVYEFILKKQMYILKRKKPTTNYYNIDNFFEWE